MDSLEEMAALPLKQAVAEKLALHRAKTGRQHPEATEPQSGSRLSGRSAQVRAAVTERYSKSQSYREFLAVEAERAIHEAEAAVEVAQRSADAIVQAQRQLLEELDGWKAPGMLGSIELVEAPMAAQPVIEAQPPIAEPVLRVQLHEELEPRMEPAARQQPEPAVFDAYEVQALDEEILFRSAPETVQPEPLAANLIEFPRQLVATRKARPRLAEGPLLAEAEARAEETQLRIFEVEPSQVSTEPVVEVSAAPEWSSLVLEAHVKTPVEVPAGQVSMNMLPQTAPINARLMAGVVDGCLVMAAAMAFITVFALTAHSLPTGHAAVVSVAVLIGVLATAYQALFFTLTDATPGMRYAQIGLCTFSDENPTRAAMRKRALAMMLSAAPLGLGFLWAWLDEDGLSWHDRIAHMYQRSYAE